MEQGRIPCPLCGKVVKVRRKRGTGGSTRAEALPQTTTEWGTEGFSGSRRREEYGEIKKGDELGNFRVEGIVGAGAMAVVYRATQLSLNRTVALKILPRELSERKSFVRQFDSETALLSSLNHPNIVTIHDRGREGGTYYFAMEYVEGTTLGEMLAAGQMDEDFLMQIMEQCCEALVYAHAKGVIHRDLKPANIMLNEQGIAKIADFGVAGLLADAQADTGGKRRVMGTRGYMPPEQELHVNKADERSDIFALGAVMYRALTDRVPDMLPPRPPSELNPNVDPRIDSLVLKCLEAGPDRRYGSAQELLEAVQGYRRTISGAQEVCPNCKKPNPVTQRTCIHCGADLSALFDACPECGAQNRLDVEICMSCGRSLRQLRQQTAVWISTVEERARALAVRHRYDEAIAELGNIANVGGRMFERARSRARRLISSYVEQRLEHHKQNIGEAKRLAGQGALEEALALLTPIPAEIAKREGGESLRAKVRSRMVAAQEALEQARGLLEERRLGEAEQALGKVARLWSACPGLEEVRKLFDSGRQTEEMVRYELAEARRNLEEGNFVQARQAMGFAMATMADRDEVQVLLAEINQREANFIFETHITNGQKAFSEGRYLDAINLWSGALKSLPEGDERRAILQQNVEAARSKGLGTQIVPLQIAEVVPLRPARSTLGMLLEMKTLVSILVMVLGVTMLVGVTLAFLLCTRTVPS
jgi:predicted Ser/Thr protein kinase